jgi:solute carrier family 25 (mitochondrial folate transporter), member 32
VACPVWSQQWGYSVYGVEQMKNFAFARKRQRVLSESGLWREGEEELVGRFDSLCDSFLFRPVYTEQHDIISALAKLGALTSTYPYQVIRSRLQNARTTYPHFRTCVRRKWQEEGYKGFYRGLGTNLVRVLSGTCVTFVVYENLAWALRTTPLKREVARSRAKDLA